MKKIIIDKDMLVQLKHPIKLTELKAINTLLSPLGNFCIEVYAESQTGKFLEVTISSKEKLEEYLKNN